VWEHFLNEDYADIFGVRVNQSGVVLDTVSIAISNNLGYESSPSVAFDGTNYLVVWEEGSFESNICGTRVDQSGNVLNPGGIIISNAFQWQYSPSVAFDGTNYLVVWTDWDGINSFKIYGARVNQSGTVLDPGGIAISNSTHDSKSPSIAFDGIHYLVVWVDAYSNVNICGARVDQSGNILDPGGFPISIAVEGPSSPSVAFDGTNYFVLWSANCSDSSRDIYGARVDTSGVVIDSFVVTHQSGDQISPALAHGMGDQFLITYTGWTDSINGHLTNAMRIWGKFNTSIGVEEKPKYPIAQCWKLRVYPNPFRKRAEIRLWIEDIRCKMDDVSLRIYDVSGRLINSISLPTDHSALPTTVSWDGRDNSGKEVHAGVYFLKFKAGKYKIKKKLLKIK